MHDYTSCARLHEKNFLPRPCIMYPITRKEFSAKTIHHVPDYTFCQEHTYGRRYCKHNFYHRSLGLRAVVHQAEFHAPDRKTPSTLCRAVRRHDSRPGGRAMTRRESCPDPQSTRAGKWFPFSNIRITHLGQLVSRQRRHTIPYPPLCNIMLSKKFDICSPVIKTRPQPLLRLDRKALSDTAPPASISARTCPTWSNRLRW